MDVGVAWLCLEEKGYVYLSKVDDSFSFSQTLALIRLLRPTDILVSDVRKVRCSDFVDVLGVHFRINLFFYVFVVVWWLTGR